MLGSFLKYTSETAAHTPHEIPAVFMAAFSTCAIAGNAEAKNSTQNSKM